MASGTVLAATVTEERLFVIEARNLLWWLLKDIGWVLVLRVLPIFSAVMALLFELIAFQERATALKAGQQVHNLAVFAWLTANSVWMVAELMVEPSAETGKGFPWFEGPWLCEDQNAYDACVLVSQAILVLTLLGLAGFYAQSVFQLVGSSERRHSLIFGAISAETYQWSFIAPWILKDLGWTMDTTMGLQLGLCSAVVVIVLVFDCVRRFGGELHAAELLWVFGNTIWFYGEVGLEDKYMWPRVAAASAMTVGALVLAAGLLRRCRVWSPSAELAL